MSVSVIGVLFKEDCTYVMLGVDFAISANSGACAIKDLYACSKIVFAAVLADVRGAGPRCERRWLVLADTLDVFTSLLLVLIAGVEAALVSI